MASNKVVINNQIKYEVPDRYMEGLKSLLDTIKKDLDETKDIKVYLNRAQSGGDAIQVTVDNKIVVSKKIHLLPKRDGIAVFEGVGKVGSCLKES